MKHALLLGFFLFIASARAESISSHGFNITAEPIVGYEFSHLVKPSPHTGYLLIYGVRFTVGGHSLAGEGEYTRGNANEYFLSPSQAIDTLKENIRLGVRSTYAFGSFLSTFVRAGGQASRQKVDTTPIGGTTSTTTYPWVYHPYAGLGFEGAFGKMISAVLDATYVFNSTSVWSQNDIQASFSVKVHLNSK